MKKILISYMLITACIYTKTMAQSEADMKAWQDYMTPGDMHKMMAKYSGSWIEDVSVWMQPGAAPLKTTDTVLYEMILGGRYQQAKIKGDFAGMPFEAYSLLGYDNIKKVFTSTWVDNFGSGTLTLEGTWDAASKTITFKGKMLDPMSGKDMDVKETLHYIDDDTQQFDMYMVSAKGEFKTTEINFKRYK